MTILERHPKSDILRYLDGAVDESEKRKLDEHFSTCAECREYISFVKGFNEGLANLSKEEFTSSEPCPDSWTLVSYEAGDVDEETARNVRVHLLLCDKCAKEFYALRRASREESWREIYEGLKESVIDLAKTYGQALVGTIRIITEQPALATRGGEAGRGASKVLEIPVGENTYSIEVAATEDGSLSFDIAGVAYRVKVPLNISSHSEIGGELSASKTDEFGNGHISVPPVPGEFIVIRLDLQGDVRQILLRVPERKEPA